MFEIKLNHKQFLNIKRCCTEVKKYAGRMVKSDTGVLRQCAELYARDVTKSLWTGMFSAEWPPLSEPYATWKKSILKKTGSDMWWLSGSVFSNVHVWRTQGARTVLYSGLKKNRETSHIGTRMRGAAGGKRSTLREYGEIRKTKGTWYASIVEKGLGNLPPRPLFATTWTRFTRRECIIMVRREFNDVRRIWRDRSGKVNSRAIAVGSI
jgi:hypothetical protein